MYFRFFHPFVLPENPIERWHIVKLRMRACQPESNLVQPDRNIVQIAITPSEPIQNTAEEFHQQLKDAEVH